MKQAAGIALLAFSSLSPVKGQGTVQDFTLNDTENEPVSYSDLKGDKLTVIDFWATWCQPCVSSIPKLVEIRSDYMDKGVAFIGISVDSPRNLSKVKPFSHSLGIDYPVLLDLLVEPFKHALKAFSALSHYMGQKSSPLYHKKARKLTLPVKPAKQPDTHKHSMLAGTKCQPSRIRASGFVLTNIRPVLVVFKPC